MGNRAAPATGCGTSAIRTCWISRFCSSWPGPERHHAGVIRPLPNWRPKGRSSPQPTRSFCSPRNRNCCRPSSHVTRASIRRGAWSWPSPPTTIPSCRFCAMSAAPGPPCRASRCPQPSSAILKTPAPRSGAASTISSRSSASPPPACGRRKGRSATRRWRSSPTAVSAGSPRMKTSWSKALRGGWGIIRSASIAPGVLSAGRGRSAPFSATTNSPIWSVSPTPSGTQAGPWRISADGCTPSRGAAAAKAR